MTSIFQGAHLITGFALLLEVGGILCFVAYAIDGGTSTSTVVVNGTSTEITSIIAKSTDNLYLGYVLISVGAGTTTQPPLMHCFIDQFHLPFAHRFVFDLAQHRYASGGACMQL